MSKFKLSTKADWKKHWSKHELIRIIPECFSWHECLKKAVQEIGGSGSAIELGGFPGDFSVYLKRFCNLDVTLLDYIIDHGIVERLFEINGLNKSVDVKIIEEDIFFYEPQEQYDLVCSFGFIEHFTDLERVLCTHFKFMKPGGMLLMTLPNFIGVNGWLQKIFDPENLAIHNLEVMEPGLLKNTLSNLGMRDISVQYYPSTSVWLEGLRRRSFIVRLIIRFIDELVRILARAFGKQNRWFSNSIVIFARNPL